ncbi:hypothetical protein JCM10207_008857 [Rhodosporidiobolus poonsookiae]
MSLPSTPPSTSSAALDADAKMAPAPVDAFDPGHVQTDAKSMRFPLPPVWPDTIEGKLAERKHKLERLACAFRVAGKLGFDEGISGHFTLRDPVLPTHFWVNPLGLAFSLVCVSDLLLISPEGNIVMGGKPDRQIYNQAAYEIHHAIHTARPDVHAACHAHSLSGKAFSAFGRKIDTYVQDACAFYGDLAVYPSFGGVVLSGGEGEKIAEHLADNKAIILQNHGILTTAGTIDAALAWYIFLDRLCHAQLLIDAAAAGSGHKPIPIGDDEARWTRSVTGTEAAGWNGAQMYFDIIDAETGGSYKL